VYLAGEWCGVTVREKQPWEKYHLFYFSRRKEKKNRKTFLYFFFSLKFFKCNAGICFWFIFNQNKNERGEKLKNLQRLYVVVKHKVPLSKVQ